MLKLLCNQFGIAILRQSGGRNCRSATNSSAASAAIKIKWIKERRRRDYVKVLWSHLKNDNK